LSRLYDPDGGSIAIGGVDLRAFSLDSLRSSVSIVAQDSLVFDASFHDNVTFMSPDADAAQIERVLATCRLEDVLARLPDGMDAMLGQRGFRLSGGERQRICLARALLQRPDCLVLDEALTGVDVEMERAILGDLRVLFEGRTLVVVTHRLSSISGFDQIVLFENGTVAAQGTHDEMRRSSEWYRAIAASYDASLHPVSAN
jgi:ABC-type multidrug transport system fused ATPase/permease subunit